MSRLKQYSCDENKGGVGRQGLSRNRSAIRRRACAPKRVTAECVDAMRRATAGELGFRLLQSMRMEKSHGNPEADIPGRRWRYCHSVRGDRTERERLAFGGSVAAPGAG